MQDLKIKVEFLGGRQRCRRRNFFIPGLETKKVTGDFLEPKEAENDLLSEAGSGRTGAQVILKTKLRNLGFTLCKVNGH